MALDPVDPAHAAQIQAGTRGRQHGHAFEDRITRELNALNLPRRVGPRPATHLQCSDPAIALLDYIAHDLNIHEITGIIALSTGALATSELGRQWLQVNGVEVRRCKSDLLLTVRSECGVETTVGVSVKQCSTRRPTNAQLYFSTARGFARLLAANGLPVSPVAVRALRQFCGDPDFRPLDDPAALLGRNTDPRRYFWEEIDADGRAEWTALLTDHQNEVTRLLLQKAYFGDPFTPSYLLHKTCAAPRWGETEIAIYGMEELIRLSRRYRTFWTRDYVVRKGSYRDPPGILHPAPRFGIVQMQRGGQVQHPDQLQFNLEAGYFYKLENVRDDMPTD